MISTLLGTLAGGVFRLAPEILKWIDRKDERKHELALLAANNEADRIKIEMTTKQIAVAGEVAVTQKEMEAMIEAVKSQGQITGIAWVDAVNSLVRPFLTFWWCIVLYTLAMTAQFYVVVYIDGANAAQAVLQVFGPEEKTIAASIFSFWFLDRTLRRGAKQ